MAKNNSIREVLNKDDIISSIKLLRNSKFILIVEGQDDILFFKKFIENNQVEIYESFSGKIGVFEIINSKDLKDHNLIGVVDKDYSQENNKNIYYYDHSCLEMMLFKEKEIFLKICTEHYKEKNNIPSDELYLHIFEILFYFSILRKINFEKKYELNLKMISLNKYFDQENNIFDYKEIFKILKKNTSDKKINISKIEKDIFNQKIKDFSIENFLDITNGHDFMRCLQIFCNLSGTKRGITEEQISSELRIAYSSENFKKTELYQEVNKKYKNIFKL